jgi:hypothetical protein
LRADLRFDQVAAERQRIDKSSRRITEGQSGWKTDWGTRKDKRPLEIDNHILANTCSE